MDPKEILLIVDTIHRDKNIDKDIVFEGIESALVTAARRHYGDDQEIEISIDRKSGEISGTHNGEPLSPAEMAERIGAQTAKQVMIQKIREAERDALYREFRELEGQIVSGTVQRLMRDNREGGSGRGRTAIVSLGNVDAILPEGEQIPGETVHVNDRIHASVFEVRKSGSRVKVILSRTKPQLVQFLFEQEIPEIVDGVIEIRAIAREPGNRSKVAVISSDQRVDCVGACVGMRGSRIKAIVDELAGERIDIVRYDDDYQVFIPNALQPAEVEEVILCQMLGRAIVLVREEQLALAIGKQGRNVRLASKLVGWDIEIMTRDELDEQLERAVVGFASIDGVEDEVAEMLVGEGFLTYDDLAIIEPEALMAMGNLTMEQVDYIVEQAEAMAAQVEQAAEQAKQRQRDEDAQQVAAEQAEQAEMDSPQTPAEEPEAEEPEAEEPAEEESPAEQASEETPVEETPVEETPVEQESVEEQPADEQSATAEDEAAVEEVASEEQAASEEDRSSDEADADEKA